MNLKSIKLSTNIWIILSVVILMIFFYLFYFEYYIKAKQDRITSTRFRVLDQMGKNINKRSASYVKNVADLELKIYGEWRKVRRRRLDTASKLEYLKYRLNNVGDVNKNLTVIKITSSTQDAKYFNEIKKGIYSNKYLITKDIENAEFKKDINYDKAQMVVETSYENLINGLERTDVFDGLVLIKDGSVVYNTLNQEMILMKDENGNLKFVDESKPKDNDSPQMHLGRLVSGEVFDLTISNRSFKAFVKPIKINDEIWFSVGLMNIGNYKAASRSIDPWIIVLLSLLLIYIILGMPIVKLKVLSNTEQLDTKTIINYALSIVLGGAVTVLFLIFFSQDISRQQDVDRKLKNLSDTIYNSFKTELSQAYAQMEVYGPEYNQIDFEDPENLFDSKVIKDIFSKDEVFYPNEFCKKGDINQSDIGTSTGSNTNEIKKGLLLFPYQYPYGDYYFWANSDGHQIAYLTPFEDFGKLSNLSSRDYINKKDEWFFPGRKDVKFRLESIVSVTSGAVKAAISKKGIPPESEVVAISTKLYSIINTIIPRDYSYCIIDKKGKVWFHSNENLNLKENFINECNNDNYLNAALYANLSKSLKVNYYNEPHRIYIQPLDNLPLYLVTLYNQESIKSFQSQVVTITLVVISILLLLIFIQIIALLLIEGRHRLPLTKNILMKLARPNKRLNSRYTYLMKVYIIVEIIFIPFIIWFQDIYAISAVFILTIILFAYSYLILNDNKIKIKQRKWFTRFNIGLLLLLNILSVYFIGELGYWKIVLYQIVIFAAIYFIDQTIKKDTEENKNYWVNYTRFLLFLMIMFGLIPTLKFYEVAYNTETEIRTRHKLTDLMKQREFRNNTLTAAFNRITPSTQKDEIFNNRKNLGVYTHFSDNSGYSSKLPVGIKDDIQYQTNHWNTMISYLRPLYDSYLLENKFLLFNDTINKNISWYRHGNHLTLRYNSLTEKNDKSIIQPVYISSEVSNLSLFLPFSGKKLNPFYAALFNIAFWLIMIPIIFIFFRLLKFGIFKIFCQNIIENYFHQDFNEVLKHQMLANKDIFVARLSSRDETELFTEDFKKHYGSLVLSWIDDNSIQNASSEIDQFKEKNKGHETIPVLIEHFDRNYDKPEILKEKLKTVRDFISRNDIKLVLCSQVSPDRIIDYYQGIIDNLKPENSNLSDIDKKKLELHQSTLEEFVQLMKAFLVDHLPVRYHYPKEYEEEHCYNKPTRVSSKKMITSELEASDYLMQFENALIDFNKSYREENNCDLPEELIISKINMLAENYYTDLFDRCSAEEKYVLLDMAYDMIMNPKNEQAIVSLLKKGLLVKKCYKINLMNISFRRFVISKLSKETKMELEVEMGKGSGSWQGYRATLVLIIIALFVFIAMANQDFIDDLNQLFIALGGGIAVITGVIGLMSRKSAKSPN